MASTNNTNSANIRNINIGNVNKNENTNSNNENNTSTANESEETVNETASTTENIENSNTASESFVPLEPVSGNMNTNANKPGNKLNRLSNFTMKNKSNNGNNNIPKMTVEALTKVCEDMLTHHIAMKMFHFQTDSYAAHKASDNYITEFLAFHDLFMETAQGIYGKMTSDKHNCTTALFSSTSDCVKHIDEYRMKMKELRTRVSDQPDLVNMLDEQIHRINQLKYLLTFK
jgi:hypothetical protein